MMSPGKLRRWGAGTSTLAALLAAGALLPAIALAAVSRSEGEELSPRLAQLVKASVRAASAHYDEGGVTSDVVEYRIHPLYDPKNQSHDVAVVVLGGRLSDVPVARLAPHLHFPADTRMRMAGWVGSNEPSTAGPRGFAVTQQGEAGSASCFAAHQSVVHSQTLPQTSWRP